MTDAIPSDHPSVESHRVELAGIGSTGRPQLPLPVDLSCSHGDFVRLVLGGTQAHAKVVSTLDDDLAIQRAGANRRLARTEEGTDLFAEWVADAGYGPGSTLVLDVLTRGYAYGLREPGSRLVYEAVEAPDSSLADIADSFGEK